jgi:hypothetical protein
MSKGRDHATKTNIVSSTLLGNNYAMEEVLNSIYNKNYADSTKASEIAQAKEEATQNKANTKSRGYYGPNPDHY